MNKLILVLFPGLSVCYNLYAASNTNTIISGIITNRSNAVINIIKEDIINGRNIHSGLVKDDGSFKIKFSLDVPKDIYLDYNNQLITIYLHPGDSIYLTANGKDVENSITFAGDRATANKKLRNFWVGFGDLMAHNKFWKNKADNNADEFADFINHFKIEMDSLIASLKAPDEITSWMYSYNNYRMAEDLFEHGLKNKVPFNHKLYNLVDEYASFKSTSRLNCTQYYESASIQIKRQLQAEGKYEQFFSGNFNVVLTSALEKLKAHPELEIPAAQLISQVLSRDYETAELYFYKFLPYINNEIIKEKLIIKKYRLDGKYSKEEDVKSIAGLSNEPVVGSIFSELSEFKGNVLYIDIWGIFCGPCIKEFPASIQLYNELRNEPVKFVYLCSPTEKSKWQHAITKYNLQQGHHILLSEDQYALIQSLFKFSGIPRYMIVDKDGQILDENAERPGSEIIKNTLMSLIQQQD